MFRWRFVLPNFIKKTTHGHFVVSSNDLEFISLLCSAHHVCNTNETVLFDSSRVKDIYKLLINFNKKETYS